MTEMKVICCTMFSPSNKPLADISLPVLRQYAERHGYEVRVIDIDNGKFHYKKHEIFKWIMDNNESDIIAYFDVDSLITNLSVPIENFLDEIHSFYITEDCNELNGGAVIIKNDEGGKRINDFVLSERDGFNNEQNIYNYFRDDLEKLGYMKVVPHPSFNSYDYSLYPEHKDYWGREDKGEWKPGNFVIHFPGLKLEDKIEMLKEYKEKIQL